ncbi:MAG: hypothetical protein KF789_11580 [Bdellovibrionaceae bacterium]|nr:hypothetical protein [Pseudobdellovibrionaceae bacterium]
MTKCLMVGLLMVPFLSLAAPPKKSPPPQKRKVSSSHIYECVLMNADGKKPGDVLNRFVLRTPAPQELQTVNEFSLRWLTLKVKIQLDGTLQYAVNEYGQEATVAAGYQNLSEKFQGQEGFEFFLERKVRSAELSAKPSHYAVRCR